eukprot:166292_1
MVKKYSWIYIGLILKRRIKHQRELPSASSSPSYAIGPNKNYSFDKSPQNLYDILQTGLKKGISDSDKSTQQEALKVLTLFSLLDETRAERLISRMSGHVMRLYKRTSRSSSISPRTSLVSPKHALMSPRSQSLGASQMKPRRQSAAKASQIKKKKNIKEKDKKPKKTKNTKNNKYKKTE